jgi:hypothetical protein
MPPIDPAMQAPPGQPPGNQPMPEELPPENPLAGGTKQASPEEQKQLEEIVGHAWELIYADNTFPQVVEMLKGGEGEGGDPAKGLAEATNLIVGRVVQMAEEAGQPLAPDVLFHAGAEILEDLAEISRVGRIKDYSTDPDAMERAWFEALDLFRTQMEQSGTLDEASAQAGMDQLMQADQDGTLERTMRGLADADRSGQAGGPEEEMPPPQQRKPRGLGAAMGG